MPMANNPTGETQADNFDNVKLTGPSSTLKSKIIIISPTKIENIMGFNKIFLTKGINGTSFLVDNSKKKSNY